MNDLISVIIPIYNAEEYLNKCIDSLIKQTYKNIEILLINDGSTDDSPKICDEYSKKDSRVKVIHKENSGVSDTRNFGLEQAKGTYITFVDADDWVEENYVEKLYNAIIENNADYASCGYNRVYGSESEKINSSGNTLTFNAKEYLIKLLNVQSGYGFCHMKLIKKDVIGSKKFYKGLPVGEDALFNIELCKNMKKIVVIEEPLYNYRFNKNSVVRKYDENYVKKYQESMEIMNEYISKEYSKDEVIKQNLYNYIAYHILLVAVNYCFNPHNKNKIKSLKALYDIEIFKTAIKFSNYDMMSFSRKITLFSLKYKLIWLTGLICGFRQLQFKVRN